MAECRFLADDANVPSLMSLPYLGAVGAADRADAELYQNTRRFLLTPGAHAYFARASAAEGMASPHTGQDMIWPMGIIIRGIPSGDPTEITRCLDLLKATHAATGFMHESFNKDDPSRFTRTWFAWANTLFGEFILQVLDQHPRLLTR